MKLAQQYIACRSVTFESVNEATQWLHSQLLELGFECHVQEYLDGNGLQKLRLSAKREPPSENLGVAAGHTSPLAFFCHTDVVPVDGWQAPFGPFSAEIADGRLWGRGACDMKGPTAAALAAIATIKPSEQTQPIYFFATGDEECGMEGARLLSTDCRLFDELIARDGVGVIGEPTSMQVVNAHKGACHLVFTSRGVAAHSSTGEGENANWKLIPWLAYLKERHEHSMVDDQLNNLNFTPSSLTMNLIIKNEPTIANITVGTAACHIFLRPTPETKWEEFVADIVNRSQDYDVELTRKVSLAPVRTPPNRPLVSSCLMLLGQTEPQCVSFATDGCSFQRLKDLVVIGPGSIQQAHRPDEWISIEQLAKGTEGYSKIFRWFTCKSN